MDFYDPFTEDFEGEEQEQEPEPEENSDSRSDIKSNSSNSNTQEDHTIEGHNHEPSAKLSISSINAESEEIVEENAWAKNEFGLEAVLQKTSSQFDKKKEGTQIKLDPGPDLHPKPLTTDNTSNTPLSGAEDNANRELSRKEELVSGEIYSLVMGNSQQMETSKIVENITSRASSHSKSKFFNEDFEIDEKVEGADVINDILSTDFNQFMLAPDDSDKPKLPTTDPHLYPLGEVNGLAVVKEEGYTPDSSANKNGLNDMFEFNPVHRSTYSFGDRTSMLPFDAFNDEN